eukprot:3879821-Alexandrium_andersonii.AAC.1
MLRLRPSLRRQIRNLREERRRAHPSGASGPNPEAIPEPAQFKLRVPEAMLVCVRPGGLRIGA